MTLESLSLNMFELYPFIFEPIASFCAEVKAAMLVAEIEVQHAGSQAKL